jgi:hypothetical protein
VVSQGAVRFIKGGGRRTAAITRHRESRLDLSAARFIIFARATTLAPRPRG